MVKGKCVVKMGVETHIKRSLLVGDFNLVCVLCTDIKHAESFLKTGGKLILRCILCRLERRVTFVQAESVTQVRIR